MATISTFFFYDFFTYLIVCMERTIISFLLQFLTSFSSLSSPGHFCIFFYNFEPYEFFFKHHSWCRNWIFPVWKVAFYWMTVLLVAVCDSLSIIIVFCISSSVFCNGGRECIFTCSFVLQGTKYSKMSSLFWTTAFYFIQTTLGRRGGGAENLTVYAMIAWENGITVSRIKWDTFYIILFT